MRFFGSELDLIFEDCATISTLLSAGNEEHRLSREFQAAGCSADPGSQGQRWIGDVRHWQHGDHPVGTYRYHVRVLLKYLYFMRKEVEVAYGDGMPTLTVTHEAPLELIRHPIVIDPAHAPDGAGAGPYLTLFLACLPALDMTQEDNARRVLAAIRGTGGSHAERKRLTAIILKRATDAAREILEAMMETDEWKDDFIESYVKIGVDQGREEGREEGAADTKAQDVLKVIDARKLKPTGEQRAMVSAAAADIFKDDEG